MFFWLAPYFNLINYKYQQREYVEKEVEQHVLQMTPSAASSTKATNPIINLSGNRKKQFDEANLETTSDMG